MTIALARTLDELFTLARAVGAARTRKGGWALLIGRETGRFALYRYHHLMLAGNLVTRQLSYMHQDMRKTDRMGVNRFLKHFGFAEQVHRRENAASTEGPTGPSNA